MKRVWITSIDYLKGIRRSVNYQRFLCWSPPPPPPPPAICTNVIQTVLAISNHVCVVIFFSIYFNSMLATCHFHQMYNFYQRQECIFYCLDSYIVKLHNWNLWCGVPCIFTSIQILAALSFNLCVCVRDTREGKVFIVNCAPSTSFSINPTQCSVCMRAHTHTHTHTHTHWVFPIWILFNVPM